MRSSRTGDLRLRPSAAVGRVTEIPDPARHVVSVCRESTTAWRAVCALLDHAEDGGLHLSPWSTSARDEAERVRSELETALLSAQGEMERAPYNNDLAARMVQGITTSLSEDELAFAVARVLDDRYWPSFTHDWLQERGHTFALSKGERYPVAEMRLMGAIAHSSLPHRLALPNVDLPHVRRRSGEDNFEVVVEGSHAAILDGLMGKAPLTVAAALINDTWGDLAGPPNQVAPNDPGAQMARIERLLEQARERDAAVVVLPELCATAQMVERLAEEWAGRVDAPVLFAGSVHLEDDGRRVNRTSVLLPGVGEAWTHDKYSVFEARDGTQEPIDPRQPGVVLGCGDFVRVATVICKDALELTTATLLGNLGVHLLAVPAMSEVLGPFSTAPEVLIARSQGATVVANNPRVWHGEPVDHALLGHPVVGTPRVSVRASGGAPDLGIARLGSGWEP